MLLAADYPFLDILGSMLVFAGVVIWLWLLFAMIGDLFTRHDISGWAKAAWIVLAIVLPIVGVLVYLGTQGAGMAERKAERMRAAQAQLDEHIRETARVDGTATEIARARQLLDEGSITAAEFEQLKRRALA